MSMEESSTSIFPQFIFEGLLTILDQLLSSNFPTFSTPSFFMETIICFFSDIGTTG